ncbi:MAG: hypothetical protein IH582_12575, partial [Afipia sp.]|nr:hypothetical protein [Afipia sp.]
MKSILATFLTIASALLFSAFIVPVSAQDQPATTTLEEVTADSTAFWGSEITLEGVVETFLNVNMFVLSEGAALDDDRVLVINNSGQPFSPDVVLGDRVLVTGIVHPARNQYDETDMNMAATPD